MDSMTIYKQWLNNTYFDQGFRDELASLEGNPAELEDRFYRDLEFGTAGMRGIIGAGRNRMNRYIVQKASQGFANYLLRYEKQDEMTVVIAYDNRRFSAEFALETALVMAGNGIKAYIFESLRTTPELSFAVRELKASGGVVITASHNPPAYNGYKVYGSDGAQLMPDKADQVVESVNAVVSFEEIKHLSEEEAASKGLLKWIGEEVDRLYFDRVKALAIRPEVYSQPMGIVYTPLHGTGGYSVTTVLKELGVCDLILVDEQMVPDPEFTTAPKPNPEELRAFDLALKYGKNHDAELLIATDPDSDRVGIVVRDSKGEYIPLNGNQTGALLLEYMLSSMKPLPQNPVIIKTIVTSDFGASVARAHGVKVMETLTGFKFIGDKIKSFERDGSHTYLMGYEESYGYLIETFVRDKDAVSAVMMLVEMAKYYKQQGKSMLDVLEELFKTHGYYRDGVQNITMEGKEGLDKMNAMMASLRENPLKKAGGFEIEAVMDVQAGSKLTLASGSVENIGLPASNVLKYLLPGGEWFAVRPSGTEPKIKIYYSVRSDSAASADERLKSLMEAVEKIVG